MPMCVEVKVLSGVMPLVPPSPEQSEKEQSRDPRVLRAYVRAEPGRTNLSQLYTYHISYLATTLT